MRRTRILPVAATVLGATVLGALALTVSAGGTLPDRFSTVDIGDLDAVTLELIHNDGTIARVLIREGEMGSVRLAPGAPTLGIEPESISLRGDAVRLALYELDRGRGDAAIDGKRWIEDLELVQGEAIGVPAATQALLGSAELQLRLHSTRFAKR